MARATTSVAAEDSQLVSVRLLRDYVPKEGRFYISETDPYLGTARETRIFIKEKTGDVLDLPRDEARAVIAAGIAKIDADLV